MSSPVSLGIDLGTSELKAILMDVDGAVLAHAGVRLSVSRRHSGWSEQAPQDWWQACLQALEQLRAHAAFSRVVCIGLSGQMHGAVNVHQNRLEFGGAQVNTEGNRTAHTWVIPIKYSHMNYGIAGSAPGVRFVPARPARPCVAAASVPRVRPAP